MNAENPKSDVPSEVKVDIRALANLARLEISDEEVVKLEGELPSIIAFVETIQGADVSQAHIDTTLRNVTRADGMPHESGIYTEALLAAAPTREGDRVAVKQVVTRRNNK